MGFSERLFPKSQAARESAPKNDQAVLVYIPGSGLADEIYAQYDLATLEDQLIEVIERDGLGELDGSEMSPLEAVVYMYAPDAERLYTATEPVLRAYPLCRQARVVIRRGEPGAQERMVDLSGA